MGESKGETHDFLVTDEAATLRESDERYRTLFDSIDEGFCVLGVVHDESRQVADLVFEYVNRSFERQTGLSDVVGRTVKEVLPNFERYWLDNYAHVIATGESIREENYVSDVDRWYRVYFSRLGDEDSRSVAVVFDDVSQHKRTESLLRQGEDRQTFLLELADAIRPLEDAAEIQDVACRKLGEHLGVKRAIYFDAVREDAGYTHVVEREFYAKPGMTSLVGRYPQAATGSSLFTGLEHGKTVITRDVHDDRVSDDELEALAAADVSSFVAVPLSRRGTYVGGIAVLDASPRTWSANEVRAIEEGADRAWSAVGRARAERAASQALAEQARQQHRLAGEQAERSRWARELHDETLQGLAAIQVQLVAALQAAEPRRDLLASASELVRTEIANLRSLIRELRPPALEELGLEGALASVVAELDGRDGAEVTLAVDRDGTAPTLSPETEVSLYRIVQEALGNAAEHAGATHIDVAITRSPSVVEAVVSDDGAGFDPHSQAAGYGLTGMRERAELAGAKLDVTSQPGAGTTIRVVIPVS